MAVGVLGIDAAWTTAKPSGLALVRVEGGQARLVCAAPSYRAFVDLSYRSGHAHFDPAAISAAELIHAAEMRADCEVRAVSIDMPLSRLPIVGRRLADNAISRTFGAFWAGTHTPSAHRPGRLSDRLREEFGVAGYPLITAGHGALRGSGLLECYPHPALIRLLGLQKRAPYKIGKSHNEFADLSSGDRRRSILKLWREIAVSLDQKISGALIVMNELVDEAKSASQLKSAEDVLDAIVCAWVGVCALTGEAEPFGGPDDAIWVPTAHSRGN